MSHGNYKMVTQSIIIKYTAYLRIIILCNLVMGCYLKEFSSAILYMGIWRLIQWFGDRLLLNERGTSYEVLFPENINNTYNLWEGSIGNCIICLLSMIW